MTRHADLLGRVFSNLTVAEKAPSRYREAYWHCQCVCGGTKSFSTNYLLTGRATNCGCIKTADKLKQDLANRRFGKLTAIKKIGTKDRAAVWQCVCDCGETRDCLSAELRKGAKTQCVSCVKKQQRAALITHGSSRRGSPGYDIFCTWSAMISRCISTTDSSYHNYGGRGIYVCDRWLHSFEAFREDMGSRPLGHTIERVNNDGPYSPDNCIWADHAVQVANRRNSLKVMHENKILTAKQYTSIFGVDSERMYKIKKERNLSVKEATDFIRIRAGTRKAVKTEDWLAEQYKDLPNHRLPDM